MKSILLLPLIAVLFFQTGFVAVPSTKVRLIPPAEFKASDQFPGFGHQESGSSILVTELPAPFSKITEAFVPEQLAKQNMTLLNRKEISISGKPAVFLHLRQSAQGMIYLKWLAATGTESETVLITGTCLESEKARFGAALEKSVLSAEWNSEAKTDPLEGLNFSIDFDQSMKFARRVSNMMIFTPSGTLPGKPTNDPLFIVGSSLGNPVTGDLKIFAESRVKEIGQVAGLVIKKQTAVTIAGLAGSEIIAEAAWKDRPGDKVIVYQMLLRDENGYYIAQGFAPLAEQAKYLDLYQRLLRSFHKK